MDTKLFRNSFIWLIVMVFVLAIAFQVFRGGGTASKSVSFTGPDSLVTRLQHDISNNIQATLTQDGTDLTLVQQNGDPVHYTASISGVTDPITLLKVAGVATGSPGFNNDVSFKNNPPSQIGNWLGAIVGFLPLLIFGALLFFMMRQAQGSNNQALSFGKSRARMFAGNRPTITFADVAGVEEAKQELAEVVEFLKYPDKFAALGARIPRGVLLVGPPGTGKTLLSRAVAGEAGVPFFSISGSEFVEMFVGVGASRVRDLFDQAKRNAPCIVFVDEIDAVGRQRGAGLGGSHDEREQTLNQILVEMDGFDTNTNVIVIAATNRPDVLDPALLRPGRFDRQVVLDNPDIRGRIQVLEVHARGKPFEKNVNLQTLAKQTPGFSGADLANLLNEAAILAARRNKKAIGMAELEEAIDRVIAGPERKSRIITEKEKAITAYHEVGHALVARMLPNLDTVHKITIVARGLAGGYTRLLPSEDRYLYTKSQFEETLAFALGGHAAEQLIFGEITTGASNDIERATTIARQMVTQYGMSEKIGPLQVGKKDELVFLGRDIGEQRNYSEALAQEIDSEVRNLINKAYGVAREILIKHKDKLVTVSERLMTLETIEGPIFDEIMGMEQAASTYSI
jgi:cell division protease FtsH